MTVFRGTHQPCGRKFDWVSIFLCSTSHANSLIHDGGGRSMTGDGQGCTRLVRQIVDPRAPFGSCGLASGPWTLLDLFINHTCQHFGSCIAFLQRPRLSSTCSIPGSLVPWGLYLVLRTSYLGVPLNTRTSGLPMTPWPGSFYQAYPHSAAFC